MLLFLQIGPMNSHGFLFRRFDLRGRPSFKLETKQQKPQEEEIPIQAMAASKISKKCCTQYHRPHDLPTWGQIKTLINQVENLISQKRMPWNPENIFAAMFALLPFASPAQADLIDHTYRAYITNTPPPPLL